MKVWNGKTLFKLDCFEGPLDLLVHLIREHELDIFAIDLLTLTSQYIDYLRFVRFRDLKEAAQFLEMAATLYQIKSRSLLPGKDEDAKGKEDEDDAAASLQQRLLDYEIFSGVGKYLEQQQRTSLGRSVCA